jgi:hypothetical protein
MFNVASRIYAGGPFDPLFLRWILVVIVIVYSLHCAGSILYALPQVSVKPARFAAPRAPSGSTIVLQVDDVNLPTETADLIGFHNEQWCKSQGYDFKYIVVRDNDPFTRIALALEQLYIKKYPFVVVLTGNVCFNNGVRDLHSVPSLPIVDKPICFGSMPDSHDFRLMTTKQQFVSAGWPDDSFLMVQNSDRAVKFCKSVLAHRPAAGRRARVSFPAALHRALRQARSAACVLTVQEAGTVRRNSLLIRIPYYNPFSVVAFRQSRHMFHKEATGTRPSTKSTIEPRVPQAPRRV